MIDALENISRKKIKSLQMKQELVKHPPPQKSGFLKRNSNLFFLGTFLQIYLDPQIHVQNLREELRRMTKK
jgi:hypothetical protein